MAKGSIFSDKKEQIEIRNISVAAILFICGFMCLLIGIVGASVSPMAKYETGESAWLVALAFGLFFLFVGIVLNLLAWKLISLTRKYIKYFSVITVLKISSILKISEIMKIPEDKVMDDLRKMIGIKYVNAYIDFEIKAINLIHPPAAPVYTQRPLPQAALIPRTPPPPTQTQTKARKHEKSISIPRRSGN